MLLNTQNKTEFERFIFRNIFENQRCYRGSTYRMCDLSRPIPKQQCEELAGRGLK